jgi:N-acetylglutamate synthase-like GNAT family acetyltransferase
MNYQYHYNGFLTINSIQFEIVTPGNDIVLALIADWYFVKWNIPKQVTIKKSKIIVADPAQFQVLMRLDNLPVATAGLYRYAALLDREPRLRMHKNWLALVYTIPGKRGNGFGSLLCNYIQQSAKQMGLKNMFLCTHTAASLYTRLGWQQVERLLISGREIMIMKKQL